VVSLVESNSPTKPPAAQQQKHQPRTISPFSPCARRLQNPDCHRSISPSTTMDTPQISAIAPRPASPIVYQGKTWSQLVAQIEANLVNPKPANDKAQQKLERHAFMDDVVRTRVHGDRDAFIALIHQEDVCRLASRYHNGDPCTAFTPPIWGSYNICYFVEFGQGDRWVVRIPLAPTLAISPEDKLESEVAVMQRVMPVCTSRREAGMVTTLLSTLAPD